MKAIIKRMIKGINPIKRKQNIHDRVVQKIINKDFNNHFCSGDSSKYMNNIPIPGNIKSKIKEIIAM
jgi:hypothetical protein